MWYQDRKNTYLIHRETNDFSKSSVRICILDYGTIRDIFITMIGGGETIQSWIIDRGLYEVFFYYRQPLQYSKKLSRD